MPNLKIGLIREGKRPYDKRVALAPSSAKHIVENKLGTEVVCQSSNHRAFSDQEYIDAGVPVVEDLSDCDLLLGVKEVPIEQLIPNKTYFFFSHTIKQQEYNRELLRAILQKQITLIDYECLTSDSGNRLLAFGRYAGIVGAYNSIWAFGKRYRLFSIKRAKDCFDLEELKQQLQNVKLPPIKIALTGGGRVAKGAMEVLLSLGIRRVSPSVFLHQRFDQAVFVQLNARDYHVHKQGDPFTRSVFFSSPEVYESRFLSFAAQADILISGSYWNPAAPALFTRTDIMEPEFCIKVIGDISCDIDGPIPSTRKASTIEDPLYDYNPSDHRVEPPLSDEANITVMAIDNLPGELPRDASLDFGEDFIQEVLPALLESDDHQILTRATIASQGKLTSGYQYLQKFVEGS